MKFLLSKASQAHRCGCRACSTVVSGLGRRVTAAPRRKATFAEIFTACYSSVFASATIIDAVRKEERRQDLDRQLEEVRTELAELKGRPQQDELDVSSTLSWLPESQMEQLWDSMKDVWLSRPYMKEVHQPATLSSSELRARLQREHYNTLDADEMDEARQAEDPEFLDLLERAMVFEETERSIPRRGPADRKHLYWFSKHIETMIGRLMSEKRVWARHNDKRTSPSFEDAQELLGQGFPRYKLASVAPETARQSMQELNHANREVLADESLPYMERVGRVCYNLLVSAYPPDLHSFNALILAFDRVPALRPLNRHVIDGFFHRTYFIPTPTTYPAILRHLRRNDKLSFLTTIARMAGVDGSGGAKLRRRHIEDVDEDPRLQDWALQTGKRTWTGDYVYQHAPLNRLMVEEILRGLLSCQMFDAAVSFLGSCVQAGVQLTSRAVKLVLDECLYALDWSGGVRLVQSIANDIDMWSSMLESCDQASTAYLIDRIYSILDMIGLEITNRSISNDRLESVGVTNMQLAELEDMITWTNGSLPSALSISPRRGDSTLSELSRRARSRLLQLESIEKECERVRRTTASIESKLVNPENLPQDMCVSIVQHVGDQALENSTRLAQEALESLQLYPTTRKSCSRRRTPTSEVKSPHGKQETQLVLRGKHSLGRMIPDETLELRQREAPKGWWEPRGLSSFFKVWDGAEKLGRSPMAGEDRAEDVTR